MRPGVREGTCPDCGGAALFGDGFGACQSGPCWWAGKDPDSEPTGGPIEDVDLGDWHVRVEIARSGFCWSVYLPRDVYQVQYRGYCETRDDAWREALGRLNAVPGEH